MRGIGAIMALVLLLAGCETQDAGPGTVPPSQPVAQPVVNLGVGVGNSGTHAYGGVGFFQGPFSVYLGF